MKRMRSFLNVVACVALVLGVGCRMRDYRELEFRVPDMKNEACAAIVRAAINSVRRAKIPGNNKSANAKRERERAKRALEIDIDIESRTVTLGYDSIMVAEKNIEHKIAKAGFAVETHSRGELITIPADKKAREALPPECR